MPMLLHPQSRQLVRRFDGLSKTITSWDGLRKDRELWCEEHDCHVHLSARGTSQRGPSLKIPLAALERAKSPYLLDKCLHRILDPSSPIGSEDDHSDSGYGGSISGDWTEKYCQLYIAAPPNLTKDEAFAYHICTRNYFAYILSKPVVGCSLGIALAELWQRVQQWHPDSTSRAEFLKYCKEQGYLGVAEDPDYALALLVFSEHAHITDTWIDAFVHCVGMHDRLDNIAEFEHLSNTTKALVARASLEMDLHIDRVARALRTFLEEELGSEFLGLSKESRHHLDRFRSFLHTHYVEKAGYFPPPESELWDKQLWFGMYHDFHSLYDYLADTQSTSGWTNGRGVNGGICVTQNISAFNERHGYMSLAHPLPLIPAELPPKSRTVEAQKALRGFRLGKQDGPPEPKPTSKSALMQAANIHDVSVTSNSLVQDYMRFERGKLEAKISQTEARKIRWLLIYGCLQMLVSITRAPKEVVDTETPSYPLCVLTTGCPPWISDDVEDQEDGVAPSRCSAEMAAVQSAIEGDHFSIRPDCEADNAEDFFSKTSLSRSTSTMSLNMMSTPLRSTTQLPRTVSLRSMVGSLSRRNSLRRNSLVPQLRTEPSYHEILVPGYGNGADESRHVSTQNLLESDLDDSQQQLLEPYIEPEFYESLAEEPVLEFGQLASSDVQKEEDRSPTSSNGSVRSSYNGASGRSSYLDNRASTASEVSSTLDPGHESEVDPSLSGFNFGFGSTPARMASTKKAETPQPRSYQPRKVNVNAGCYTPTGSKGSLTPQRIQSRVVSSDSICSMQSAGSVYADGNVQAAEIEEEELRGRRRSRALDKLTLFRLASSAISLSGAASKGR